MLESHNKENNIETSPDDEVLRKLADKVSALQDQRNNKEIIELISNFLDSPLNTSSIACDALIMRAEAFLKHGDLNGALIDLNKSLDDQANNSFALWLRGDVLHKLGRYQESNADFCKAHLLEPTNATFMASYVTSTHISTDLCLQQKDYNGALRNLNIILGLQPNDPAALGKIGVVYHKFHHHDEAYANLTTSHTLDPLNFAWGDTYSEVLERRANKSKNNKNYPQALEYYNRSLFFNHNNVPALLDRAYVNRKLQNNQDALNDLNTVLIIQPQNGNALRRRAEVNELLGNNEQAIKDEETSLIYRPLVNYTYPIKISIYLKTASHHIQQGNNELALELLNKSLKIVPGDNRILFKRANVYKAMANYKGACADYERILESSPKDHIALKEISCIFIIKKNYTKALQNIRQALSIDNANIEFRNIERRILDEQAQSTLDLINAHGNSPEVRRARIVINAENDNYTAAELDLEELLKTDKDNSINWAVEQLVYESEKIFPNINFITSLMKFGINLLDIKFDDNQTFLEVILNDPLLSHQDLVPIADWARTEFANSVANLPTTLDRALMFLTIKKLWLDPEIAQTAIKQAIFEGKVIDNEAALEFAIKNHYKLDGNDPRVWAIDNNIGDAKSHRTNVINEHFRDRTVARESSFEKHSKKEGGVSPGYVVKETATSSLYLIKFGPSVRKLELSMTAQKLTSKNTKHFPNLERSKSESTLWLLINEFISTAVITITYPKYASSVELVIDENEMNARSKISDSVNFHYNKYKIEQIDFPQQSNTSKVVTIRSKYLPRFETLQSYVKRCGINCIKDNQIQGVHALFAAMLFCGEGDPNSENIGVVNRHMAKIDHGNSANRFFTDPNIMLHYLANTFDVQKYYKIFNLEAKSLKEAINSVVQITNGEIETLINARTYQLKRAGVEINNLSFGIWKNSAIYDTNIAHPTIHHFGDFNDLAKFLSNSFQAQRNTMVQLSEKLDVISRIVLPSVQENVKFHQGEWLQKIGGFDPTNWAAVNGYQITPL
ncbi:MAG: tetratricopeptide repeat protein [Rickettsiales bacterium]